MVGLFAAVVIGLSLPAWSADVSVSLDSNNGSSAFVVENSSDYICLKVQSDGKVSAGNVVGNGGAMAVGTEDQSALELRVWGVTALYIKPPSTAGSAPSFVGGWVNNSITDGVEGGVVAGGGTPLYSGNPRPNKVTDHYGVVGGGMGNQSGNGGTTLDDAQGATVGGGYANSASANWGTVGGGWYNRVTYERGTVGGGWNNLSSGHASTVSGGRDNNATGSRATVPGGQGNVAQGDYSFAAGRRSQANHPGAFVWGDSTDAIFSSTANNQFLIRATGGVGIGTDSPTEMLDVEGNVKIRGTGNGLLFPDGSTQITAASSGSGLTLPYNMPWSSGSTLFKLTNTGSGEAIEGSHSTSGNFGRLGSSGRGVFGSASGTGDIGVYGLAAPAAGDTGVGVKGISSFGKGVSGETLNGIGVYAVASGDTGTGLYAKGTEFGFAAFFDGWIQGPVKIEGALEIRGGADLSEAFDIRTASPQTEPEAGMLVSIDREHPGGLLVSQEAYDRCVAGIISGAGGIMPAMVMGQEEHKEASGLPVALTGRVYCKADTSNGFIEPGDLLTSSSIPGHAMKVTDYERAQGAVIGKAMSALEQERGMVLVLVNLQ